MAGMTSAAWLASVPYQGMSAAEFTQFRRANERDPSSGGRATEDRSQQ